MTVEREAAVTAPGVLAADYYDGRISTRRAASIEADGEFLIVRGEFGERRIAWNDIDIGEAVGTAPCRITLPDGAYCELADGAELARWLRAAGHRPGLVERLQQRWRWVAASLAGVAMALTAGYVWLLPLLAQSLAPRIPDAVTQMTSQQALRFLDKSLLKPSDLSETRRTLIRASVARIADPRLPYRLEFRSAGKTANAFALPNGDVVIFDGLVDLAKSNDEIVAVVAHELGHVHHRHGWRQMIQASAVSAVIGFYFGDVTTVATSVASLALESRYSREFEFEADRFGGELLKAHGMSPELLAVMLERLETRAGGGGSGPLDSHPETAERAAALRRLAAP